MAMTRSDIGGFERDGAAARRAALTYWENPVHDMQWSPYGDTGAAILEWCRAGEAWSTGWLREDAGRDEAIQRLMKVRWW